MGHKKFSKCYVRCSISPSCRITFETFKNGFWLSPDEWNNLYIAVDVILVFYPSPVADKCI